MSEQKRTELKEAAAPLMKWLRENYHPHVTAIVTGGGAELLEGLMKVYLDGAPLCAKYSAAKGEG